MDDTETAPKRRASAFFAIGLLVIAAVSYGTYRHFANSRNMATPPENPDVLEVRLQNLDNTLLSHEKRLAKLEDDMQKLSPQTPKPADAGDSATSPASPDQDGRIAALEKQIASLKATQAPEDRAELGEAIRLLSSYHHLSDKVLSGKPFAAELTAFQEQSADNEAVAKPLAALSPYAESGIPTFAQLLASFDQSVDQLEAAEAVPPPDASFWQRLMFNLRHLVSIRRSSEGETGATVDAVVTRASGHLEREEIEAAMAEIKSLPEVPRSNFTPWLEDAQIATDAPALIDQIEEQVMLMAFHADGGEDAKEPRQ